MIPRGQSGRTLAPALRDRLLRGRVTAESDNPLTRTLVRLYRPFVHFALSRPALTLTTAGLALASCLPKLVGSRPPPFAANARTSGRSDLAFTCLPVR